MKAVNLKHIQIEPIVTRAKFIYAANIAASSIILATSFGVISTIEILREFSLFGVFTCLSVKSHLSHDGLAMINNHLNDYIYRVSKDLELPQPQTVLLIDKKGTIISSNIRPWLETNVNSNASAQQVFGTNQRVTQAIKCLSQSCEEASPQGLFFSNNALQYTEAFDIKKNHIGISQAQEHRYLLLISFSKNDIINQALPIFPVSLLVALLISIIITYVPYQLTINALLPKYYDILQLDPLTDLNNRSIFTEKALNLLRVGEELSEDYSLAILDIDNFKVINDNYGHTAGDQVIRELASIIKDLTRVDIDLVSRFGGEEFAILLKQDQKSSELILERLRYQVELHTIQYELQPIKFTLSIGAISTRTHGYNFDYLMKKADTALYTAKHRGKNCIQWEINV